MVPGTHFWPDWVFHLTFKKPDPFCSPSENLPSASATPGPVLHQGCIPVSNPPLKNHQNETESSGAENNEENFLCGIDADFCSPPCRLSGQEQPEHPR